MTSSNLLVGAVERTPNPGRKERIAASLEEARSRTLGLLDPLSESDQRAQHSPLMSPLVWDLAHVGNYEDLWLERGLGGPLIHAEYDDLYDAFRHPRADRLSLPILGPAEARRYVASIRERVLDRLDGLDPALLEREGPFGGMVGPDSLLRGGFVYAMVIEHEHQHDETMLATLQLMGERATPPLGTIDSCPVPEIQPVGEREVAGGPFLLGTDHDRWAYDNERPECMVEVAPFRIDAAPVTNARYLEFVEDGGYDDRRHWTAEGWTWRTEASLIAPQFWQPAVGSDGRGGASAWRVLRFGRHLPLEPMEPVQHVCWYEADAFARWAGRRLPTEVEWEYAASWDPATDTKRRYPWGDAVPSAAHANLGQRHCGPNAVGAHPAGVSALGCHQMLGDVWEWTSSDFRAYPGFAAFPYPEYSAVFWGPDYKVLRGGSWGTHPSVARATFRNWDFPIRRQIFAGFRCASDY